MPLSRLESNWEEAPAVNDLSAQKLLISCQKGDFMRKILVLLTAAIFVPIIAAAHCDTLGGPVIMDAKLALQKGDVALVLKWVKKQDEEQIKNVFAKTMAVRSQSDDAREIADMYFFETLVRIHRAGEGAPFTGLKPASAIEPEIQAADKALAEGTADTLIASVTKDVTAGIRERFNQAMEAKKHANASVDQGREYVEAYVQFLHYIEHLHESPPAEHE